MTLQKTGQKYDLPEEGEKNIFRNPSSTKWSLYTMLFSLSVSLAPKNAQTKFHAWKLEASVHNFDIPEWLQSTICTLCTSQVQKSKFMVNFSSVSGFCYHPSSFFFIISNVGLERKDTLLSKENAIKRFFTLKDVFCLDLWGLNCQKGSLTCYVQLW